MDGLAGPAMDFSFLSFIRLTEAGRKTPWKIPIFIDLSSEAFSLLASVNPNWSPRKRFFVVVYGI